MARSLQSTSGAVGAVILYALLAVLAERNPLSTAHAATRQDRADAQLIWDYQQLGHQLRPCSAGIGLGSHDLGVATLAAGLYRAGLFPVLVFSGGNSSTTAARFPVTPEV